MPEEFSISQQHRRPGDNADRDKSVVALLSVCATVGLIVAKLVVGFLTGSLAILAEAAQSTFDLVSSVFTLLAVRVAGRPPDPEHRYGHGKAESLAAFIQAALLLVTAGWVSYQALQRLFTSAPEVRISVWAFLVMIVSLIVDLVRARALDRVAREHSSQALAADALNFKTDILSSTVVLAGLSIMKIGEWTGWNAGGWVPKIDALAALGVSGLVFTLAWRMVRETVDVLLDRAPDESADQIVRAAESVPGVLDCRRLRLRRAGDKLFADLVIAVARSATFGEAHAITEAVEDAVHAALPGLGVDVVVHMEPVIAPDESPGDEIRLLARQAGLRAHDVRVRAIDDRLDADLHVEVDPTLTLVEAHALTANLEREVRRANPQFGRINTHLEAPETAVERQADVTTRRAELVAQVRDVADAVAGQGSCHDVKIYRVGVDDDRIEIVLHCWFPGGQTVQQVHQQSAEIERRLHNALPTLREVLLHAEPIEDDPGAAVCTAEAAVPKATAKPTT